MYHRSIRLYSICIFILSNKHYLIPYIWTITCNSFTLSTWVNCEYCTYPVQTLCNRCRSWKFKNITVFRIAPCADYRPLAIIIFFQIHIGAYLCCCSIISSDFCISWSCTVWYIQLTIHHLSVIYSKCFQRFLLKTFLPI